MRLLVTGYKGWLGNALKEDSDKVRQLTQFLEAPLTI
jgi:dTDP-4-dehydrorhamnose reductase